MLLKVDDSAKEPAAEGSSGVLLHIFNRTQKGPICVPTYLSSVWNGTAGV